jgi:hypothetical protein
MRLNLSKTHKYIYNNNKKTKLIKNQNTTTSTRWEEGEDEREIK